MASDNFTRANEDPLASPWTQWSSFNRLVIASNLLAPVTSSTVQGAYRTDSATGLSAVTTYDGVDGGPGIHLDSSGNGYVGRCLAADTRLYRADGGSFTELANVAGHTTPNGTIQELSRVGGDVVFKHNGSTVTTVADSTHTGGYDGAYVYNNMRYSLWQNGAGGGGGDPVRGLVRGKLIRGGMLLQGLR